ncbi:carbohydrate-binding protein [Flavobacterium sp. ASW18X]|uniref:carbohydrate-binding protein n=1 Tax=Flavobacterium sp. ASW18X TaxID=2572595 RepID=UPI0010AE3B09|nr:carbohydrate-binding protein [Flavobacterium sp. ASW18X]TKD65314.1 T9SS type A sorting domain-containing protein [Flavobacterium sp. ASW18X]
MKKLVLSAYLLLIASLAFAQEWNNFPVPAYPGANKTWQLVPSASDDFNYQFNATNAKSNFGSGKWYNFYHYGWDGPGTTYWKYNHVSVNGTDLVFKASRWKTANEPQPISVLPNKMNRPNDGINAGCITSNSRVKYPVFVEAWVSVADIVLASDVWLLSPDDTQEIDIIECYGGNEQGNAFFSEFIHLSHHSFVRQPFTDYQPRDFDSWWSQNGVSDWGSYHWNNGNRRYVRIGVHWISPTHFEYYIDGNLVRVLYDKAVATNRNGTWSYTYPTMTNGQLDFDAATGFQKMITYATASNYSLSTLQAASNASSVSIIDPYNYQNGNGFTKEMDIIINVESQNWHVEANRTPTDAQLNNPARNTMKVDWIRTYKPVDTNATGNSITIQAERFSATNGSFNDGLVPFGANKAGTIINYVNGGDYMDYLINIPESGAYEVTYTYATPLANRSIEFGIVNTPFFTNTLASTGNWNSFSDFTAPQRANFTAGNHILRIKAGKDAWQWNLDKITLKKVSAMVSLQTNITETKVVVAHPNPTSNQLQITNGVEGSRYQFHTLAGKEALTGSYNGNFIDTSSLANGIYILTIEDVVYGKIVIEQ